MEIGLRHPSLMDIISAGLSRILVLGTLRLRFR
jgi:hypothetical protein